jgi:hypothetical protein
MRAGSIGFAQKVRCEPPPAAFGGSPPHEGENTLADFADVIVPPCKGDRRRRRQGVAHTALFVQNRVNLVS